LSIIYNTLALVDNQGERGFAGFRKSVLGAIEQNVMGFAPDQRRAFGTSTKVEQLSRSPNKSALIHQPCRFQAAGIATDNG
jgi:hypothetical protein